MEIKLHDIGEGMTEAEIVQFFVKPGDRVVADQPIVEVQTDKMVAEIPAPTAGTVRKLTVEEGKTITIGTTVLLLEPEESMGETAATSELTMEKLDVNRTKESDRVKFVSGGGPQRLVKAAPYTRKVARELGVEIDNIQGTGKRGRITVQDVHQFADRLNANSKLLVEENKTETIASADTFEPIKEIIPFRGRRKQIAKKMTQSLYTIPHVSHFEEIDVTNLLEAKTTLREKATSISSTAFFIKAISTALKEFPIFNAKLDEEKEVIELYKDHHIGIAVDTEEGLIVPVLKNVQMKSIRNIHEEMKLLVDKAQANKLSKNDITGGTFTISNVGPLGGSIGATPIINYPEVALLAFHKTKKRPVVLNDEIVIRSIMNISMVFDHRVVDGATAIAFTNRLQELLESPNLMMVDLT